jgi:asparagine synthase (glutamine-hydrolysing)
MCGFAGILNQEQPVNPALIARMGASLAHRGPDEGRVWCESTYGVAFQRLAIQDLSQNGSQPMLSTCERFVLAYNGEIYNVEALKKMLKPQTWRGHSDTEVILAGFAQKGIAQFLPHMNGIFALALYDRQTRQLFLARDRMGVKPLYYAPLKEGFCFASELKALKIHPTLPRALNFDALHSYLRLACFPAPHTVYQGVYKLKPAEILCVTPQGFTSAIYVSPVVQPFQGTSQEAVTGLEAVLKTAIARQMLADVPLGAFLSGGVDSSTVVALMQAQTHKQVQTFSIGFEEEAYNEAPFAKAVAQHLHTAHEELYVSQREALGVIPKLAAMYDEPFADSSSLPTFLVAQLAKQKVTVALSGDGGDELFAGYRRYLSYEGGLKYLLKTPAFMRKMMGQAALALPLKGQNRERVEKFTRAIAGDEQAYYLSLLSQVQEPSQLLKYGQEMPLLFKPHANFITQMQENDISYYLPDDILTKVDRASMAVSLEARVPLLDNEVVDFARALPPQYLIQGGRGKLPLREVLYKYVPRALIERPKAGFALPLGDWLRGNLKEYMCDLLAKDTILRQDILHFQAVEQLIQQHLSGKANHAPQLWALMMLQEFLNNEEFLNREEFLNNAI